MATRNEVGNIAVANPFGCKLGWMEGCWKVHSKEDDLVINLIVRCLFSVLVGLYDLFILGFGELFCYLIKSFGRI